VELYLHFPVRLRGVFLVNHFSSAPALGQQGTAYRLLIPSVIEVNHQRIFHTCNTCFLTKKPISKAVLKILMPEIMIQVRVVLDLPCPKFWNWKYQQKSDSEWEGL